MPLALFFFFFSLPILIATKYLTLEVSNNKLLHSDKTCLMFTFSYFIFSYRIKSKSFFLNAYYPQLTILHNASGCKSITKYTLPFIIIIIINDSAFFYYFRNAFMDSSSLAVTMLLVLLLLFLMLIMLLN